ncbi:MAG TPA: prepilin-type N-terminal cleavage/methylation domain-containing protein [Vicinamibacterales bacterium]|nr:prepilin-type N-terminal cleavage/methylation domain-containing protein [Vicinamibacterales bacterium]
MLHPIPSNQHQHHDSGFSLPELLVSLLVLSVIIGTVTQLSMTMSNGQRTMWNRTQMHSSVRGAIALLQQEVGQAGLVALPAPVTLSGAVALGTQTVTVSSAAGIFVGEQLVIGTGVPLETVTVTARNTTTNQITGVFTKTHAAGEPVSVLGGFAQGIIPPNMTNGSTATVLKLFGDVNDDGQMVYVEYTCSSTTGKLSRNMMSWTATSKPALTSANVLLSNVVANPGGAACFSYQTEVVSPNTYVVAIAVTLSVQTQDIDPVTRQFQIETKTLLNVSPRNVFNTWQLASMQETNRIQPIPASVLVLIQ